MKARDVTLGIQELLGVPAELRAPRIGPLTTGLFERLKALTNSTPDAEWGEAVAAVREEKKDRRNISARGLMLVKHFESLFLEAYKDIAGVYTIGYGHTGLQHKDGTVYPGRKITEVKALELLDYDMDQFENRVMALVKVPLTQDQFDSLVSFDFNTGGLTLEGGEPSTMLRHLNLGNYDDAAKQFMSWNKAKGKAVDGLTRRRLSERALFNGETNFLYDMDRFKEWKAKQK